MGSVSASGNASSCFRVKLYDNDYQLASNTAMIVPNLVNLTISVPIKMTIAQLEYKLAEPASCKFLQQLEQGYIQCVLQFLRSPCPLAF